MKTSGIRLLVLACVMALPRSQANEDDCRLGGWRSVSITSDNTALLVKALSQRSNYAASISKPVCVKRVYRVRQQVVSGMNYLFEATACPIDFTPEGQLGACKDHNCNCRGVPFEIQVYSQPWTNTLQVQGIRWLD